MVILLSAVGTTYYITEELSEDYDLYECYAKEPAVAMLCWKLSNENSERTRTRCYWNMSDSKRYKQCSNGWQLSELVNITGKEVIIPDREAYQMKYDFTSRQEAESYIENLKNEVTYEYQITTIEQTPYSDHIEVRFLGYIMKGEDVLERFGGDVYIPETSSKEEIESKVSEEAQRLFESWRLSIIIDRSDKIV